MRNRNTIWGGLDYQAFLDYVTGITENVVVYGRVYTYVPAPVPVDTEKADPDIHDIQWVWKQAMVSWQKRMAAQRRKEGSLWEGELKPKTQSEGRSNTEGKSEDGDETECVGSYEGDGG